MSEKENTTLVQQAYQDFKNGKISDLLSKMSPDVKWTVPDIEGAPVGGKRIGHAQVGEFFATVGTHQDSLSFEPKEFVAQGNKVIALGHYRWRVKSNGKEFESDFAHVFTLSGGRVVSFQEFLDTAIAEKAYRK